MQTERNEQKRARQMTVGLALVAAMFAFVACSNGRRDNATTAQNTKPAEVPSEGRANGVLTVDKVNVNLTHSYARFTQGFFDKNKQDVELLITDDSIPGDALLNEFEQRSLLREGKRQGLFLLFDEQGKTLSINPFTESMAKTGSIISSSGVGSMTEFSVGNGRVKGQHSHEDKMDVVWSYSLTFDAPLKE